MSSPGCRLFKNYYVTICFNCGYVWTAGVPDIDLHLWFQMQKYTNTWQTMALITPSISAKCNKHKNLLFCLKFGALLTLGWQQCAFAELSFVTLGCWTPGLPLSLSTCVHQFLSSKTMLLSWLDVRVCSHTMCGERALGRCNSRAVQYPCHLVWSFPAAAHQLLQVWWWYHTE